MWTRGVLKEKAKTAVKRSYWGLVLVCLIMTMISGGGSAGANFGNRSQSDDGSGFMNMFKAMQGEVDPAVMMGVAGAIVGVFLVITVVLLLLSIFVFYPLWIGVYRYHLECCYDTRTVGDLGILGFGFRKENYGKVVKTMFLMELYLFLWTCLFIIPGLIKSYEYRMIPYILAENPQLETKQIFQLSKEMMTGNKWDSFVLDLSFIGWIFLSMFTCMILYVFYVGPYIYMTDAFLYDTIKQNASIDYFDRTLPGAQPAYGTPDGYGSF